MGLGLGLGCYNFFHVNNSTKSQALSRRIHCGKYVAEVKFRDAPKEYETPIRSKVS